MTTTNTSHKSIVYGPHNIPQWGQQQQRPPPNRPKRNHVVVRVQAVGLNPVDAKGVVGDKLPHSWKTVQHCVQRCAVQRSVIGFDFAGVVTAVGGEQQQPDFQVGDVVFGILPPSRYEGTLQTYITVPVSQIAKVPSLTASESSSRTTAAAAALPLVGITAYQCLTGAGWGSSTDATPTSTAPPKKLLVLGASGGTGHVAVQVGYSLAAAQSTSASIVAVCSTRNLPFCRGLVSTNGSNTPTLTVLDYTAPDFVEQLRLHGPFDMIMDCVTSGDPRDQRTMNYPDLFQKDPTLWNPHTGQYRRLGGAFGDWFRAGVERTMHIPLWSNPRAKLFWIQMHQAAPILQQLATWMQAGQVTPHISLTVPFTPAGVQTGFEALLNRRVVGKVVVDVLLEEETGSGGNTAAHGPNKTLQNDKKES